MGAEENKAVMRELLEASAANNAARLRELLAPDFIAHLAVGPVGLDAFLEHNTITGDAFSEKVFTIKDQIAEGDKALVRWTFRGRHTGETMGAKPTGKVVVATGMNLFRLADGRIEEIWVEADDLGEMQQLGVVKLPE